MFSRIFVPLDGSPRAERALEVAARLAHGADGTVILASVVSPMSVYAPALAMPVDAQMTIDGEIAAAKEYLARVRAGEALRGLKTEAHIGLATPAAAELVDLAQATHTDVIVMCSHGRTGLMRWALGSVAQQVVRSSPIPVLVLKANGPVPAPSAESLRVVIPLDGSVVAEAAISPAAQLAAALSAPGQGQVHLLQVIHTPVAPFAPFAPADAYLQRESASERQAVQERARSYLYGVVQRFSEAPLADLHVRVSTAVVIDEDVAGAIAAVAGGAEGLSEPFDVIAMATHGRTGLARLAMGSNTERVLQSTKRPLLVVHPVATVPREVKSVERARDKHAEAQDTADLAPAIPLF